MQQYLLYLTTLLSLLATAYTIKCYSCESVYEPHCGLEFELENHFKSDCTFIGPPRFLENDLSTPNATACLKRVFKEQGVQKVVRGCYFGDANETEIGCRLDPTLLDIQNSSCHVCANENFCNAAMQIFHPVELTEGLMLLTGFVFLWTSRQLGC